METPSNKNNINNKFDDSDLDISLNNFVIHDSITPNNTKLTAMKSARSFDLLPEYSISTSVEKKQIKQNPRKKYKRKFIFVVVTLCSIFALLGILFFLKERLKQRIISDSSLKMAVLPYKNNSSNSELDYLSTDFSTQLSERLIKYPTVNLIPTTNYQNNQFTREEISEIVKRLGVDKLVTGSYTINNGEIIVNLEIYSGLSDIEPITHTLKKPLEKVSELTRDTSQRLNWTFELESAETIPQTKELELNNPKVYEKYILGLRGNRFGNELDKSISYLQEVVKEEPQFSLGWLGLFNAYYRKGIGGCGVVCYDEAIRAIETAAKLDSHNLRIKNSFSSVLTERNRVEEAISMMQKISKENPNAKEPYDSLAYSYRYTGLLEESVKMTEKWISLNKSSPDANVVVNSLLYLGRYEEFRQLLNKPTDQAYNRFFYGFLEFHEKNFDKAKEHFQYSIRVQPYHILSKLGKVYIYYIENNPNEGLKLLKEIKSDIYQNEVYDGEMIYKIAQAFSVLNDTKSSTELFQLSVEKGFFCYPYFLTDPLMENARKEPNFGITLKIAKSRQDEFKARLSLAID